LPQLDSIDALFDLIFRIENNEALSAPEKLLAGSSKTMGGAHPKALVQNHGRECIVKFPRGGNVDSGLIEHATLMLAAGAGIHCAASTAVPTLGGHVVVIERFDRAASQRLHCLSAKSVLLCGADPHFPPLGELSYPAMADFIRQFSRPETQSEDRKELFRRMVFNILIENTDDHEKNHAFILDSGYWRLAPAYDMLPLMANAGQHEMGIGRDGAQGTLANALSQCQRFDLEPDAAIREWQRVANCVSQWREVFSGLGVTGSDIAYLADFIDDEERLQMRGKVGLV
jgi:serine/threonine-protein kinase HipA